MHFNLLGRAGHGREKAVGSVQTGGSALSNRDPAGPRVHLESARSRPPASTISYMHRERNPHDQPHICKILFIYDYIRKLDNYLISRFRLVS